MNGLFGSTLVKLSQPAIASCGRLVQQSFRNNRKAGLLVLTLFARDRLAISSWTNVTSSAANTSSGSTASGAPGGSGLW